MLASVSAYVLTGPRVAYAMAQTGQFPAVAGRLSTRTGTPVIATVLQVAWSLVLLWTGSFDLLLTYSSVGLALFSMLTVSSVYALRWRRPDLPRPFSTPGYPVTPAIFLGATGLIVWAIFSERPRVSIYSLLSILAGVPVYFVWAAFKGRGEGATDHPAARKGPVSPIRPGDRIDCGLRSGRTGGGPAPGAWAGPTPVGGWIAPYCPGGLVPLRASLMTTSSRIRLLAWPG